MEWNHPYDKSVLCTYNKEIQHTHNKQIDSSIQFIKIFNLLHFPDFDFYYHMSYLNHKNITNEIKNDYDRILLMKKNVPYNPKYLFVTLLYSNDEIVFGRETDDSYWIIANNYIKHKSTNLFLSVINKNLTLTKAIQKWNIHNNSIQNVRSKLFIACDIDYNIYMTTNKNDALDISIENNLICHIKSEFKVKFEINNAILKSFSLTKLHKLLSNTGKKNVGILLAGGFSTRFDNEKPKQLYELNNKPLFMYSVEAIVNILDTITIITNSKCYSEIKKLVKMYKNVIVLKNDINCRLESISTGLAYFRKNGCSTIQNVIIHDSARCFVTRNHFEKLINEHIYSQYYLKLINGLTQNTICGDINRDDYVELTTPLSINFKLADFIFTNYIKKQNRITYEFITILKLLKIPYNMIEGHNSFLKKITTIQDI
jgi:2-C-methyl-D-erythritol 4-phosphate cytidylyltransferase